ncbi:MAG: hypothetical protein QHH13_08760, partial [Melioribacter sp.]|nr:hypothetical protein [Melioribacter sp.]
MGKQKEQVQQQKEKKTKAAEETTATVVEEKVPARLKVKYFKEIVPKLKEQFGYKNVMQVPRLEKIVINKNPECPICGTHPAITDLTNNQG